MSNRKVCLTDAQRAEKKLDVIGGAVRVMLRKKKIPQRTVAEWLDISSPALNRKLNGDIRLSVTDLMIIFKHLELTPDEIWNLLNIGDVA